VRIIILIGILVFGLGASPSLYGQEIKVLGIVKDSQTFKPIPWVHITAAKQGTYSNEDGFFLLSISPGESLSLTHVAYQTLGFRPTPPTTDTLFFFLSAKDNLLSEIEVIGLPSEEKFKQQILRKNVLPSREVVLAQNNVQNAQALFLSGYVPSMNSEDNYRWYINGPQGITLFSTGANRGLPQAIRHLIRYPKLLRAGSQDLPLDSLANTDILKEKK